MSTYFRFLFIGLILGLHTEIQFKLIAGIKPAGFIIAVFAYPVIISLSYLASRWIDRLVESSWKGDLIHYFASGVFGLAVEWGLLGNGPGSNAFQLGMFAMWTSFCFGPRVLTRPAACIEKSGRGFWWAFASTGTLLAAIVLSIGNPKARLVVSILGLSGLYIGWSIWLLRLAWQAKAKY